MKAVAAFLLVLCYLAGSHAWNCRPGPSLSGINQIDAGLGKVVATTSSNRAYTLIGSRWYSLGSVSLKHISVGPAGLWGTSTSNRVYKSVGGNVLLSSGTSMQQVDAGGDGEVVASSGSYSFCLRETTALAYKGVGNLSWNSLGSRLKYVSCSPNNGCWGVDTSDQVYFTKRVTSSCSASGWSVVGGLLAMVEVGTDGSVFGVNKYGSLFERLGISSSQPAGTGWRHIPMCTKSRHVAYDLGRLWVVTTSGTLMKCTH